MSVLVQGKQGVRPGRLSIRPLAAVTMAGVIITRRIWGASAHNVLYREGVIELMLVGLSGLVE